MSNYVLQNSFDVANVPSHDFSIEKRRNLRVTDNNNGNYASNSILFDLATISNSNMYPSWHEAVLTVPINISVTTAAGTANSELRKFAAGLKNGTTTLIDGFNITLSNMPVVGYQRMNVGKVAYELATEWSADDWNRSKEWGAIWEDGVDFDYSTAANDKGIMSRPSTSKNLTERASEVVADADAVRGAFQNVSLDQKRELSKATFPSATQANIQIMARIPLGHLDDYFRKCPLTKNSLYRMEFFINTGKFKVEMDGAKNYKGLTSMSTSFGFNPIQIGDAAAWGSVGATSIEVDMAIKNDALKACVIDIPMYELSPTAESSYLSDAVKTFNYNKVLYQKLGVIASDQPTGNLLISSGTSRARKLVMLPCYEYASVAGNIASSDMLSPNSSFGSGFLSSPFAHVSDFNVIVSGIPLYNTNLNTPVEFFNEFKRETLNNGVDTAVLNASKVDLEQYKSQYGAIVVDLTQNSKEKDDDLSKSYSVTFTNPTKLSCSYLCYLYYEATVSVNAETGQIVL